MLALFHDASMALGHLVDFVNPTTLWSGHPMMQVWHQPEYTF